MTVSRAARDVIRLLGQRVAIERRAQRRTAAELAERAGISRDTLHRVERGDPRVAIGTVIELLTLLGVPLLEENTTDVAREIGRGRLMLDLLPDRVRTPRVVDDDF